MKKILILPVHGMGTTDMNYAEELRGNLSKKLGADFWQKVAFLPVFYQDLIQNNQYTVWNAMDSAPTTIEWKKLRQFMLFSFSDAAALEHHSDSPDSAYLRTQERIRGFLLDALETISDVTTKTPVVLLPHSLGAQVFSNYIWDSQRHQGIWKSKPLDLPDEKISFLKLETLHHIASAGCNIPLFVAGLSKILPFAKPHPRFSWENYYDPDDALGWPLRPLSHEYAALVGADNRMNSGGFFTSWTPFSHASYWRDKDFLTPVAKKIQDLLK